MAAEAEAAREARAKVIAAEGEQKASKALREAAETIADSHSALQVNMGQGYLPIGLTDLLQGWSLSLLSYSMWPSKAPIEDHQILKYYPVEPFWYTYTSW